MNLNSLLKLVACHKDEIAKIEHLILNLNNNRTNRNNVLDATKRIFSVIYNEYNV